MNTDRFLYRGMTVNGKWVYGYLSVITKEQKAKVEPGFYISNKKGMPFAYDVRPETVGQCTVLKDEYGELIFEGDIISFQEYTDLRRIRGVIRFLNGTFWCDYEKRCDNFHLMYKGKWYKVGNIHEKEKDK